MDGSQLNQKSKLNCDYTVFHVYICMYSMYILDATFIPHLSSQVPIWHPSLWNGKIPQLMKLNVENYFPKRFWNAKATPESLWSWYQSNSTTSGPRISPSTLSGQGQRWGPPILCSTLNVASFLEVFIISCWFLLTLHSRQLRNFFFKMKTTISLSAEILDWHLFALDKGFCMGSFYSSMGFLLRVFSFTSTVSTQSHCIPLNHRPRCYINIRWHFSPTILQS